MIYFLWLLFQSALNREKNRVSNLSAALDLARAQHLEEIETEKKLVAQLKSEIESKQVGFDICIIYQRAKINIYLVCVHFYLFDFISS